MSLLKNCLIIACCAIGAMGQTVTTSGGTVGTIPVFTGSSSIDNSNMFQFRARIGINTTSPLGTLHVSNDGNTALVLQDTTVANSALWYFAPSALSLSSDTFGIIRSEGGNSVESKSLFITNAGNFGIGTAVPFGSLHIAGNAATALVLQDTTVGNSNNWQLQPTAFMSDQFGIVRYEGGTVQRSKSFVISDLGNVGIGTTSPGQKLVVEGNINIAGSGAGLIFPDGSVQTTAQVQGPVGPQGPQGVGAGWPTRPGRSR